MKKNIIMLFCLCMLVLLTGCKKSEKENEIEIKDGFITYAIKDNSKNDHNIEIANEKIIRFDEKGNFKYFESTNSAKIPDDYKVLGQETADMSDDELAAMICTTPVGVNQFEELKRICQVKDRVYKEGYSFTNKTVEGDISNTEKPINYEIKDVFNEYLNINTEAKVQEYFEQFKNELKKSEDDILIIANKKIELSN